MNDHQLERLRARFDQLDVDGNGYIEAKDFDLVAARLLTAFGESERSAKGRAVLDSHRFYWQGLSAGLDTNKDERISFDEFTVGVGDTARFDQVVRPYAEALVALADRDDDGYVEHDDFVTSLEALGFTRGGIEAAHASLSGGDGRIPAGAWVDFIGGFYTAGAESPGQLLVTGG